MKEMTRVFIVHKIVALLVALFFLSEKGVDDRFMMITTLAFLCLFMTQIVVELILNRMQKNELKKWISFLVPIGVILYLYFYGTIEFTPVFILFLIEISYLILQKTDLRFFLSVLMIPFLVLIVTTPSKTITAMTLLISTSLLYVFYLTNQNQQYKNQILTEREKVIKLDEKIKNNNQMLKTIKYSAMLEERNRLAIRLHDKIGHNISGSIMMLEAAMLTFQKDQEKSLKGIQKATEILRSGVDDIRMALREERPAQEQITSNDIQMLLDEFRSCHDISTFFRVQGDGSKVSMEIWNCVKENVIELLTNVLKHSSATSFSVELQVLPAMIKVVCFDNGSRVASDTKPNEIKKGLGLEAIEERTIRANGTCFFEWNEFGFVTTTIFRKV